MPCARLSVTTKFVSQRLKYPISIETRGSNCCWIDAPKFQSAGRTPQPWSSAGSTVVSNTALPNDEFATPAHSPFIAGFSKSQSGTKLSLVSVHVRVVVVLTLEVGRLAT